MGMAYEKRERKKRRTAALAGYRAALAAYAEARLSDPPIHANWHLRNAERYMIKYKFTQEEIDACIDRSV